MLAKICSAGLWGVEAYTVEIETNVSLGLPSYTLVGLPDNAVKEGFVRVRAALENCGFPLPPRRVTVNFAPANIRKDGAAFDLPIAVSLLKALGVISSEEISSFLWAGELGLQGDLRAIKGSLPMAMHAKKAGFKGIVLPAVCAGEAQALMGLPIYPMTHLKELVGWVQKEKTIKPLATLEFFSEPNSDAPDISDVFGNEIAKRALEISAAGGHNLLLIGPPGSGKSMLAKRLAGLLPPMIEEEAFSVTSIYSAAGILGGKPLLQSRPFRAPHHDISVAGLIGGGSYPKPGEISLSHHGVLFLDELLEFKRPTLEALRQPLEDKKITISRARYSIIYPASFSLVAAMNPCPCGYYGSGIRSCICSHQKLMNYRSRLSGPLLDRFDLHVAVPYLPYKKLMRQIDSEKLVSSKEIRAGVIAARALQLSRKKVLNERASLKGEYSNAFLKEDEILKVAQPDSKGSALLEDYSHRYRLSNRAVYRILKVARTIADLHDQPNVKETHLAEAMMMRCLDRD